MSCGTGIPQIEVQHSVVIARLLSMAPRNWATVAEESCTTYLTTDVGKSGKVATIWEREETDLTLRPIFRQSRP